MADKPSNQNPVESEAKTFATEGKEVVHQEAYGRFADELFKDLFNKARNGSGDPNDRYKEHQGPLTPINTAADLQKLFDRAKGQKPGEAKPDNLSDAKNSTRVLEGDKGQFIAPDGKVTTRLDGNRCIEYDPKAKSYTSIDKEGKRTPLDPNSQEFKDLQKTVGKPEIVKENGQDVTRVTQLDGSVTTTFPNGNDRTTYPPGRIDGLRQTEHIKETPPGDKTENSGRTVQTFEDRKETSFDKGDISKITATKNPDKDHPAVITEYRDNKGPEGASKVSTYKDDGNPGSVKQIAEFRKPDPSNPGKEIQDKPDKITFNNGRTAEGVPQNGEVVRTSFGTGDQTGILDLSKNSGMPTHMQIGDRDYQITYEGGKVKSISVKAGDPPGSKGQLDLVRNEKGELEVKTPQDKLGQFAAKDGKVSLEGMPVEIKEGRVVGDIHMNKQGDLRYKSGDGPDRQEYVKRADGSSETYDFKNWKKTTTSADGKSSKDEFWDGYSWRKGKQGENGRIDFEASKPADPSKPSFIQRSISGTPPTDVTNIGYPDGHTLNCDWTNKRQTEISKDGKQQTTRFYDGSSYREGVEQKDEKTGDTVVRFKDAEKTPDKPIGAIRHKDGSMTSVYADGSKVEKNKDDQVTERSGPKGVWKIERDADGDINKVSEYEADGKTLRNSYTRTGQEKDPGMERWTGRDSYGAPRQPGDNPPRDPNKPNDYNTWVDKDGKPVAQNFHTTSDGTIRVEKPAQDGKTPELSINPPTGDNYRDTPNARIIDRPGGVTETIDKTKNPQESSLKFSRNGNDFIVKDANGPYDVKADGTVVQTSKDGKTTTAYLPDGSVATLKNEAGETPKQTVSELKIAVPGKPGEFNTLAPGTAPCKSLEMLSTNKFKAVITDGSGTDVTTVFDTKAQTKQEQRPGENFAKLSSLSDGKLVGVNTPDGRPLLRYNPTDGSMVGPNGKKYDANSWNIKPEDLKASTEPNSKGDLVITSKDNKSSDRYKASGAIVETRDGKEKTIYPNKTESRMENGKLMIKLADGKEYEAIGEAGKISGLKAPDGSSINPIPAGTTYSLNDNGFLVSDSKDDKTNVSTHLQWNPSEGSATIDRSWPGADGQTMYSGVKVDKDGKVVEFSLPSPNPNGMINLEAKKKDLPKLGAKYEGGELNITVDDNQSIVVKADGSMDTTVKGAGNPGDLVQHRDSGGNLVPKEDQVAKIAARLAEDLKDQNKRMELATEVLSRFTKQGVRSLEKDIPSFITALNKALNGKASFDVQPAEGGGFTLAVTVNGQTINIPWSKPAA